MIVGKVSSGKSSLLSSILGECEIIKGNINVYGNYSYVGDRSWLKNSTIRDNIIFGSDLNEDYYEKCIFSCGLAQDINKLPGKDLTEIGERGKFK